jgi:hypothetical protein
LVDVDTDILDDQPADVQPPVHRRHHQRAVPDAALVIRYGRHLCARHITVKDLNPRG